MTGPTITEIIDSAVAIIGLPETLMRDLLKEDDWSFVIKTHALLEAAVTFSLTSLTDQKLASNFERLPFNEQAFGKVSFLASLAEIDKETITFLRYFSELRNKLAHNIRYANFTFAAHAKTLDKHQRANYQTFCAFYSRQYPGESRTDALAKAIDSAKVDIYFGALQVLLSLVSQYLRSEDSRSLRQETDESRAGSLSTVWNDASGLGAGAGTEGAGD